MVFILHADMQQDPDKEYSGADEYCKNYDTLASHLASHGYVVASIARVFWTGTAWDLITGIQNEPDYTSALAKAHCSFLSKKFEKRLTGRAALISHSAGAQTCLSAFGVYATYFTISAFVLYSPSIKDYDKTASTLFDLKVPFLGLHELGDRDGGANGIPDKNSSPGRIFRMYDRLGPGQHKDTVTFAYPREQPAPMPTLKCWGHFFHNLPPTRAFTTAFLGLHVRGMTSLASIFKWGAKIPEIDGLLTERIHQHREPQGLFLLNAEWIGQGDLQLTSLPASAVQVGDAYTFDYRSAHVCKVVYINYPGTPKSSITYDLKSPQSLANHHRLSVRVCQLFLNPDDYQATGPSLYLTINFNDTASTTISVPPPSPICKDNWRITTLATIVVGLEPFVQQGITSVNRISFRFESNVEGVSYRLGVASMEVLT